MGKSRTLLFAVAVCFSLTCFQSTKAAFGLQFQIGTSPSSTDLSGNNTSSSQQQQQNESIRIPLGTTPQTGTPTGPTDQGPYIDSGGIRRPMTATEREIYERERRWRRMLAEPETDFQKLIRSLLGEKLQVYGRKLFLDGPDTFSPVDQAPVTPDYVIGPGDELLVRTWGQISFNDHLTVDRSGNIFIPHVGAIHVAGLPYSGLEKNIRAEIGRVFRNFDVTVNMGQLRSIQVYVVGQAVQPGSYTVSSLSTLVTSVFTAGGPSREGSMRHIQLRRGGQTIGEFDLYDLMSRGDKSKDLQLISGDVVYIPPVGPQVAFGGSVKNPAIYELKDETTTISQLLEIAGGTTTTAAKTYIQIDRVLDHSDRQSMRVSMDSAGLATALHDGDILRFSTQTQRFTQAVTIRGNLANPGRFAWHEGMRLTEVIPEREALLTNNYWQRRNALGLPAPMFEPAPRRIVPTIVTSPLGAFNQQNPNAPYNNNNNSNYNYNFTPPSYQQNQFGVNPTGEENDNYPATSDDPGTTDYSSQDSSAPDYQNMPAGASGMTGAPQVQGLNPQSQQTVTGSSLGGLSPQGQGTFPQGTSGNLPQRRRVDVKMPAPEIDWSYAVIERLDSKTLKNQLLPFNLGKLVLDHDESQNLELQPGDIVTIFSQGDIHVPLDDQTKFVRLEGEFASSGVYSVLPGETLRQLVARAGGLTHNAYLYGSQFTRESTRRVQQQRLDEYTARLTAELQRSTVNNLTAAAGSTPDANSFAALQASQQQIIQRLGQVRATGRMVLELKPDSTDISSIPDLPLENGDIFVIPSKPSNVNVVGAVYDQNSFVYISQRTVGEYLKLSGGPNRSADRKHSFVIRADGSVYSHEAGKSIWGNEFLSARMYPGDTIVVPEKVFNPSGTRQFLQWSQIISSLALGAATIGILATQ
jgi:protein involved in polysaccharide export with SLBB domain